jgi:hypothetical protein
MSTPSLLRWSGWSLLIGGLISAPGAALAYLISSSSRVAVPVGANWLEAIGGLLLLPGIVGIYCVYTHRLKFWEKAGFVLLFTGILLEQVLFHIITAVTGNAPALLFQNVELSSAQNIPTIPTIPLVTILFVVGAFLLLIGAVLTGIVIASAGIFPRWCGWLLVIMAILVVCGSSQGVISTAASTLFALTLSYIGYLLVFQISTSQEGSLTSS